MSAGRNISSHGKKKITYADFTIEYKSMNPGVIRNIKYMACILGKGCHGLGNVEVYD